MEFIKTYFFLANQTAILRAHLITDSIDDYQCSARGMKNRLTTNARPHSIPTTQKFSLIFLIKFITSLKETTISTVLFITDDYSIPISSNHSS